MTRLPEGTAVPGPESRPHHPPPPQRSHATFLRIVLTSVLFALAWGSLLGFRPLTEPDEGRYAEIPREMVRSGDWLTPRLAGYLYFEKPPLQYWATASAFSLFGLSEWAARLWPALTGLLGLASVWFAGNRLFPRGAGGIAALLLGSSFLYFGLGHVNNLDMGPTAFLGIALASFALAQQNRDAPAANRNWMLVCYASMALAVLSKGLIGIVLPGLALALYVVLARDWACLRKLHPVEGLLLFLATAAPWFVAISLKHPDFPEFFFLREHFGRFLSPDHDRTAPVWFIPAVLAGGCLPWALFFLPPLFRGWRRPPQGGFSAPLLFRCWVVAIAGFFALSSSKMLGYIGPVFPALALLAAPEVAGAGPGRFRWTAGITIAGGCAAVVLAFFLPGLGTLEAPPEMLRRCTPFLIGTASVLAIGGGACLLALRRATNAKATLALAFVWLVALQILLAGSIGFSPMQSSRDLALQIRPVLEPESVLFSVDSYDQSLPFYVDRTAVIVKRRSEMGFGIEREPGKWIPDIPAFGAAWARSPAPVAVVPLKRVPEVQALGLDLREIARDHHRVVYAKKVNVGAR